MNLTEPCTGEGRRRAPVSLTDLLSSGLITNNLCPFVFHRVAHVEKAADALAVDTLLISDKLFRWLTSIALKFRIYVSFIG